MDETRFWEILEKAAKTGRRNQQKQYESIQRQLKKLSPEELMAFQRLMDEKMAAAYQWNLWGAAYLIQGGCSDDGFDYFCGWVIGRGRAVFEAAIVDPDPENVSTTTPCPRGRAA